MSSNYYNGDSVTELKIDSLKLADGVAITATGAELNILDGVTKTAAQINLLTTGVAAGYKIAYGTATIDAASKDIATGLTTVAGVVVSLVGDPSLTHMYSTATVGNQTNAPIAGSIRIKSWKPTAANDATPIAATSTFASVSWVAIGT